MNKVLDVRPKCAGILEVELADGRRGEFDVRPFMVSDFFRELQDEAYFNQVRIFFGGVGWPNGQDLGPDTISQTRQERAIGIAGFPPPIRALM